MNGKDDLQKLLTGRHIFWLHTCHTGYFKSSQVYQPKSPRASGEPGDRNQIPKEENPLHPTLKTNQTNFYQTRALDWDKLLHKGPADWLIIASQNEKGHLKNGSRPWMCL